MRFRPRRKATPEINLTSMIDILFIVLVFLLLTTTFKEFTFIRVALPEASTGQRDVHDERERITITADKNGNVYLGSTIVSLEALGRTLGDVREKDTVDVLLSADEELDHGVVVRILDLVRRAGIFRLSIQTSSDVRAP